MDRLIDKPFVHLRAKQEETINGFLSNEEINRGSHKTCTMWQFLMRLLKYHLACNYHFLTDAVRLVGYVEEWRLARLSCEAGMLCQ